MSHLQDAGKVSDNCETIDQVADCDLVAAYNATFEKDQRAA
jgi:hypothetical protein